MADNNAENVQLGYAEFLTRVARNQIIVLARDQEWLSLNHLDGELLPVWAGILEAKEALPSSQWPDFEFVEYDISEFVNGFTSPPHDRLYVSIAPDMHGTGHIVKYSEFLELLDSCGETSFGSKL